MEGLPDRFVECVGKLKILAELKKTGVLKSHERFDALYVPFGSLVAPSLNAGLDIPLTVRAKEPTSISEFVNRLDELEMAIIAFYVESVPVREGSH